MNHIGKETAVTIGGKTYTLARFTRKVLRQFLDWAETQLPSPIAALRGELDGFSRDMQELMVREAMLAARCRRSANSPEVKALMTSPEGGSKILALLFQQHHPELTDDAAYDLYEQAAHEHGNDYLLDAIVQCAGQMPPDEHEAEATYLERKGLLPSKKKRS